MTEISGEITSHLAALGAGTRDRLVFAILSRNPHFIEDEPVTGTHGETLVDIANIMEGLLLRFRDGALHSVRTTVRRDGDYYPFPRPADLIDGVDLSRATRGDLDALLGAPLPPAGGAGDAPDEVCYAVDGGVLTVTSDADQIVSITVTRDEMPCGQ